MYQEPLTLSHAAPLPGVVATPLQKTRRCLLAVCDKFRIHQGLHRQLVDEGWRDASQ